MSRIPDEFLREVKERVDLVELVGLHVKLRRRGGRLVGLCPMHQEKTPSFGIAPGGNYAKCFGCGWGGDALDWLQQVDGLDFRAAVEELAALAGMDLPDVQDQDPEQRQREQDRRRCLDINDRACRWFARHLPGSPAAEELKRRGVPSNVAKEARLGWAPEDPALLLKAAPHEDLELAGLASRYEDSGRVRPTFRGRLVFPIMDARGRVVGFGGRDLTGQSKAKYINTTETPAYDKSRALYGLEQAQRAGRQAGKLAVVEGYLDVLAFRASGMPWAVAPCGTSITTSHWQVIRRICTTPIMGMDQDEAGRRAVWRALPEALRAGCQPLLVDYPEGLDPDDVWRQHGAEALRKLVAAHRPAMLARLEALVTGGLPARAVTEGAELLRLVPPAERVQLGTYLAQLLGIDARMVEYEIQGSGSRALPAPERPVERPEALPVRVHRLVRLAAQAPTLAGLALRLDLGLDEQVRAGLAKLAEQALTVQGLAGLPALVRSPAEDALADPVPDEALGMAGQQALLVLLAQAYQPGEDQDDMKTARAQAMQVWAEQEIGRILRCAT